MDRIRSLRCVKLARQSVTKLSHSQVIDCFTKGHSQTVYMVKSHFRLTCSVLALCAVCACCAVFLLVLKKKKKKKKPPFFFSFFFFFFF